MPANKQHLIVNGTDHLNMQKFDYLSDAIFDGKFCKNPIYKNKQR
ncbi:MAG TPA: hypothetical protein PLU53_11670 [Bacteroidia bacterium]|nr:hypothetical protein [Bacteroidia bacterium]